MIPGRTTAFDLQLVHRRTAGFKDGNHIGLGIENADRCSIAGPMALPSAFRKRGVPQRMPAADAGAGLPVPCLHRYPRASNNARSLKPPGSALRWAALSRPGRSGRNRIIGHIGSDRIAQLELRPATAKGFCGTFRDERPRNGLHHAARSKRPLGIARADLQRCQDLAIDGPMTGQRLRLNQIDAVNAHDLFDQIRLAIDIGTPGGNTTSTGSSLPCGTKPRRDRISRLVSAETSIPVRRLTSELWNLTVFGLWP